MSIDEKETIELVFLGKVIGTYKNYMDIGDTTISYCDVILNNLGMKFTGNFGALTDCLTVNWETGDVHRYDKDISHICKLDWSVFNVHNRESMK